MLKRIFAIKNKGTCFPVSTHQGIFNENVLDFLVARPQGSNHSPSAYETEATAMTYQDNLVPKI